MNKNRRNNTRNRKGSVLLTALVALMILSVFAIVGASVMASGYETYYITSESTQALYTADSGIEMAVKEYISNSDHDGDGTIGTISNDGDDGNNPSIGAASLSVTFVGSIFTATAEGDQACRMVEVTIE